MSDKFQPIVRVNNFGLVDYLDEVPLRDGETLIILWPDGVETTEQIRVEIVNGGGFSQTYSSTAYVVRRVYGMTAHLPLWEAPELRCLARRWER